MYLCTIVLKNKCIFVNGNRAKPTLDYLLGPQVFLGTSRRQSDDDTDADDDGAFFYLFLNGHKKTQELDDGIQTKIGALFLYLFIIRYLWTKNFYQYIFQNAVVRSGERY